MYQFLGGEIIKAIFRRDIVIAVLLAWIAATLLKQDIEIAITLIFPMLLMILGFEEFVDRVIESIHLKRFIKKLGDRKVLPPASKQD